MPIRFFSEEISFKIPNKRKRAKWLEAAAKKEKKVLKDLNVILCSDSFLLQLNREFLNHDTLTDIITFQHSVSPDLKGEIYISLERVEANSKKFNISLIDELDRVLIHGVMHLCGYKDKTPAQKKLMRNKEDAYLSLRKRST